MRRFVFGFLALFVVVAVADVNAWPLTGWRLFSRTRGPTQHGWEAVLVHDIEGTERPVPFASLPRGYRGSLHVLDGFPALSQAERDAVCHAWIRGARTVGVPGRLVRVYRTTSTVSLGGAGGSPPTTRMTKELRYTCGS